MRNLIQFILKYHIFFIFLVLESISLVLVSQFNDYHRARMVNLGTTYAGGLYNASSSVSSYFSLQKANTELAEENARLKNFLLDSKRENYHQYIFNDSLFGENFYFIPARITNNTVHRQKNYITLNKGAIDGIEPGMAVSSSRGVVGSIKGVSKNYSVVIPIINLNSHISAKVDSSGYFGSLIWDGEDYRRAKLRDIEQNAIIKVGQKVVTTGFGAYFPEGMLIGTIEHIQKDDEGIFYEIDVLLGTDYKQLYHVEVIKNYQLEEVKQLEKTEMDE